MIDWLKRLLGALREAQVDLTAEDVADAVWLMPRLGRAAERAGDADRGPGLISAPEAPRPLPQPKPSALQEGAKAAVPSGEAPGEARGQHGELYLPSGDEAGWGWGRPFRSPAGSSLPGALGVARALRPLRQRVPAPHRLVFDEAETVRRIAEEGIWLPALRPARDRWLDLSLVVDAGASMGLWRSTAEELRKLLEWTGAFRNVRVWHLDTNANPPYLRAGLRYRPGMPSRDPLELVDPSGRSLVLLLSDCVSAAWYGGVTPMLETWGRRGPLVLLQVLPEHLWSRTALGTASLVRLAAPTPASPNARLSIRPDDNWPEAPDFRATPVPAATLEPGATAGWARLVAGIREVWVPGFVPDSEAASRPAPVPEEPISAEVRVVRFWRVASPTACRLAGLLAASPALSLPLIRLIRQVFLPAARQVHEAEVLLGGLLRVAIDPAESQPDPEEVRYDFHDGVRPLLLDAVPTADALGVLEKVSSYIEEHLAQGQDFRALLADPTAARGAVVADTSPFARVAAEVLQRLGGDYARLTRIHYNWGLRSLELNETALANHRLVVQSLEARLRDGTLVSLPEDAAPPALDLKGPLERDRSLKVFLALPSLRLNRANVAEPGQTDGGRYLVDTLEIEDENSDLNPQSLKLRRLNIKVLLSTQNDHPGYEVLPIGVIEKSADADALPRLDLTYIPPLLACDAWPPLQIGILRAIYDRIGTKIDLLAGQMLSRGISMDSDSGEDARIVGQKRILNEAYVLLTTLAFAEGVHPFEAYLDLCRLVGQLSIFSDKRRPPELPHYDHDDLGRCFYQLKKYLDALLNLIIELDWVQRPFRGAALRMQVPLEPAWLEPAWQMFVGVQTILPPEQCINLLTTPGQLDMKIGSSDRADAIYEYGQAGLKFVHRPQPHVLPVLPGLIYLQVDRDSQSNEWQHVRKSLMLAIRLNEQRILGSIQDEQTLTIRHAGQTATLRFTLYLARSPNQPAAVRS
jgi:type VI secretion system protein ImpJ